MAEWRRGRQYGGEPVSTKLRGTTPHFNVSYDDSASGAQAGADAIIAVCEDDYAAMVNAFGGLQPPGLPFNVTVEELDPGVGAQHSTCQSTTLDVNSRFGASYTPNGCLAEVAECFMAAKGGGWDCGHSNGEALSLALAIDQHPVLGGAWTGWWGNVGRPDYVTKTLDTDQNLDADACGTVFLFFLHTYLGIDWASITAAGGGTLAETYRRLTGRTDAYERLLTVTTTLPVQDNPFDLLPLTADWLELGIA